MSPGSSWGTELNLGRWLPLSLWEHTRYCKMENVPDRLGNPMRPQCWAHVEDMVTSNSLPWRGSGRLGKEGSEGFSPFSVCSKFSTISIHLWSRCVCVCWGGGSIKEKSQNTCSEYGIWKNNCSGMYLLTWKVQMPRVAQGAQTWLFICN